MPEPKVEKSNDVGSPEQGLESDQPEHSDADVKRNINPARTPLRIHGEEPDDE